MEEQIPPLIERSLYMSETTSAVPAQSKSIDKNLLAVGGVAAVAFAAVLAFAPAAGALSLDNVNLGTGISSQDGSDEWSSLGLRLASQDGLENLGLGLMGQNVDGDEMQSAGLGLETTDYLENLSLNGNAMNVDGDEMQSASLGIDSTDYLDTLDVSTEATSKDSNKNNNFGIKFSFDE